MRRFNIWKYVDSFHNNGIVGLHGQFFYWFYRGRISQQNIVKFWKSDRKCLNHKKKKKKELLNYNNTRIFQQDNINIYKCCYHYGPDG